MWVIGIICLIISIYLCYMAYNKKVETDDINNKIKEENEKLLKDKESITDDIKYLEEKRAYTREQLEEVNKITSNMNAAARAAFTEYSETLNKEYEVCEQEYDKRMADMRTAYDSVQDVLLLKIKNVQGDLDKITATRAAALEAQLKEQEIKDKLSFYCPQIPSTDLKDAKTLREIEYKLNNPRVLRMLIWSTFYQKPMNQVCANVLGAATAEVCGIYKITNQLTELCYIGQAVNMSNRWKDHAKAGLGIDAPAGNKLYAAMQQDGLENFSFELLEKCSRDELNEKEAFYINLYQSDQFGYNSQAGHK